MINATTNINETLIDIRTVKIDTNKPKDARICDFIKQIGNPHKFRYGKFIITIRHRESDLTPEDCLMQIVD